MRTSSLGRVDLSNLVRLQTERYGKLDVLINNAGVMPISPLDDLRVQEWEEMIDVNLKGALYGIAAALPVFRTQGFGHVVNIASTAAYLVLPTMSVYAGTKRAVRTISEGLRSRAVNDHVPMVLVRALMRMSGLRDSHLVVPQTTQLSAFTSRTRITLGCLPWVRREMQ